MPNRYNYYNYGQAVIELILQSENEKTPNLIQILVIYHFRSLFNGVNKNSLWHQHRVIQYRSGNRLY